MIRAIPKESWCFNDGDTLPTEGVQHGQCAMNIDTGAVMMFNAATKEWKEQ